MTNAAAPYLGAMPNYRKTMRHWDQARILVTFADGVVVGAYVQRAREGSGWYLGSAVRAACAKYRERLAPNLPDIDAEIAANRAIAVPEIRAIKADDDTIEADVGRLNAATAPYRVAFRILWNCLG